MDTMGKCSVWMSYEKKKKILAINHLGKPGKFTFQIDILLMKKPSSLAQIMFSGMSVFREKKSLLTNSSKPKNKSTGIVSWKEYVFQ